MRCWSGIPVALLAMTAISAREPDLVWDCAGEWVTTMSAAPDGRRVVAGTDKGVVRVWTLAGEPVVAREVRRFSCPVTALACWPEGEKVIVGTWDGTLVMLDLKNGKTLRKYEEHRETITALDFSSEGKYLCSGSADDRLIVWDLATGEDLLTMHQGNEYDVMTLAFSPDGRVIATGDGENQLKLWDADNGDAVRTLSGHRGPVSQVAFTPGGLLVSGSWDRTIRVWRADQRQDFKGHTGEITALQVEENEVFSASEDGTVRVWNLEAEKKPEILTGSPASIRCLEVVRNGELVLAGSKGKILGWHHK